MNKYRNAFSLFFIIGLVIMSCSAAPTETFDDQVETLVASTLTVHTSDEPTPAFTAIPTLTIIPPTPVPFGEIYVYTSVDNVNLRTNPGTLFSVSRVLPKNTRLRLLGQALGSEWLHVRNDEGIAGWVFINVVVMAYDGPPPPVIDPIDVYVVTGSVFTEAGTPVSGVGFAILQNDLRLDAHTDTNGLFYAYLPRTLSGVWRVAYVSISCTSNTMDENCNCINNVCGTPDPVDVYVELPQSVELHFLWK